MLFSLPMPMSVSSESLVGRMLCGPKAWLIFLVITLTLLIEVRSLAGGISRVRLSGV